MTSKTYLSNTITAVGDGIPSFNANALKLLADKQVLSRILKYSISEFKDMDYEEIMTCISDVEVQSVQVDPGLTNLGPVKGNETVDIVQNEGTIIYDIRFSARNIGNNIKILINVEAQNIQEMSKLKYHLGNRIVYYLARMISSQKDVEFFHSDYDNIKKVVSIWICLCDTMSGGIETLSLRPELIYGEMSDILDIDLMKGIVIRVPREKKEQALENDLIDVLSDLFKKESAVDKKYNLINKHGFIMTTDVEREVHNMCNLAEMYIDMGIEQGQNNLKKAILLIRSGVDTEEELVKRGISPEDAKMAMETMFSKV